MRKNQGPQIFAIITLLGGDVGVSLSPHPKSYDQSRSTDHAMEELRLLIVLSIDRSARANWDTPSTTSQKLLQEVFAEGHTNTRWSVEAIEANTIRTEFSDRGDNHYSEYYASVHIHFTKAEWWITIIDGRNLGFDGERIYKNALLWVTC